MARGKRKTKAFEQGAIQDIYMYFFRPLLKLKPQNMNFHDWLDEIFCIKDRSIKRYKVLKNFKMPGKYWLAPNRLVPGFGYRYIKKDTTLWVRIDKTLPDKIDVQLWRGKENKETVFSLTRQEYDSIFLHLIESPLRKRRRTRYSWEKV